MSDGKIIAAITIPAGVVLVVALWFILSRNGTGTGGSPQVAVDGQTVPASKAIPVRDAEKDQLRNRVTQLESDNHRLTVELSALKETQSQLTDANVQLNAEHQKVLQAEAQQAAMQAAKAAAGEIVGAAWLTREGGQSDILRGLDICLLPAVCSKATLIACLNRTIADLEEEAKSRRQSAAQEREMETRYTDADLAKSCETSAKSFDAQALKYEQEITGIRQTISQLPDQMDLMESAEFLKKFSTYAPEIGPFLGTLIMQVKTGVDGKYKMPNVPAGRYVIAAQTGGKLFLAEWLLPVTIKGPDAMQFDLDNSNSFCIKSN